jgi:hypothetical protein
MPVFTVQCFVNGIWDGKQFLEIDAENPEGAANLACGGPVRSMVGNINDLRARVWPKGRTRPEYLFFVPVASELAAGAEQADRKAE